MRRLVSCSDSIRTKMGQRNGVQGTECGGGGEGAEIGWKGEVAGIWAATRPWKGTGRPAREED